MSKSIDERIVRMIFDNKSFEENITQSMSSLDKFDKQLDEFDGGSSGISAMGESVAAVGDKFSAMGEIAVGALRRIGEHITDWVIGKLDTLKAKIGELTFDQVAAGFDKYTSKAESVQTMMGATRQAYMEEMGDMFSEQAQMEAINEQMEKLNWFTDETSYNYSDMATNIAKFTSAGVGLEDATDAMIGIANWGAVAGKNATEVGRAMYNISQAMGLGFMGTQDWRSLTMLNMNTPEMMQMAADFATLEGTLTEIDDGLYETLEGHEFTLQELFNGGLKDKWFNTDVMMGVFDTYGAASSTMYDFGQYLDEAGIKGFELVSSQFELIDSWKELGKTGLDTTEMVEKMSEQFGLTTDQVEELIPFLDILASEEMETGVRAFKAGQEYKTFKDVIDATKDAASTRWMNIFEQIFGDLLTAKALWSEMGEMFYDIFVGPLDFINDSLGSWVELGGRNDLFSGISDSMEAILNFASAIGDVLYDVFFSGLFNDSGDAIGLVRLTESFKDWAARVKESSENLSAFKNILKGFLTGIKAVVATVVDFARALGQFLSPVINRLKSDFQMILLFLSRLGIRFSEVRPTVESFTELFEKIASGISKVVHAFDDWFKSITGVSILEILSKIDSGWVSLLSDLSRGFPVVNSLKRFALNIASAFGVSEQVQSFGERIHALFEHIGEAFDGFNGKVEKRFSPLKSLFNGLTKILQVFVEALKFVAPYVAKALGKIGSGIAAFADMLLDAFGSGDFSKVFDFINGGIFAAIGVGIARFFNGIGDIGKNSGKLVENLKDALGGVGDVLDGWQKKLSADALLGIAKAIAIIAASLVVLSLVDSKKLASALGGLTVAFGELAGFMTLMNKQNNSATLKDAFVGFIDANSMNKTSGAILKAAAAVLVLAIAVKTLASLSLGELAKGLISVGLLLAAIAITARSMPTDAPKGAGAMVIMAVAVNILASAVNKLGTLNLADLAKGLTAVVILIAALTIAFRALPSDAPKGAFAMVLLASSLAILAGVVKIFSSIALPSLAKGLIAAALAMAAMVVAVRLVNGSVSGAVSILLIANALAILAGVVVIFSLMPLPSLAKGLIALAAALVEIVVASNLANGSIVGAAAIMLMAVAIAMFVPSIMLLGSMKIGSIVKSLLALAGVFAVIGIAALVLTPVIPMIALLGVAVLALGVGTAAAGAGLLLVATALGMLAAAGVGAINLIIYAIKALITLLPDIATALVNSFAALALAIGNNATLIVESFSKLIAAILDAVIQLAPKIFETLTTLLTGFLQMIIDTAPKIMETIGVLISGVIGLITEKAPEFVNMIVALLQSVLAAIRTLVPDFVETVLTILDQCLQSIANHVPSFVNSGLDIISGFLQGIAENIGEVVTSFTNIITETLEAIGENLPKIYDAGIEMIINIINGIADGIEEHREELKAAMTRLAKVMIDTVKDFLGIHSPSSVFRDEVGVNIIEGIKDGINAVKEKVSGALTSALDAAKSAAQSVASTFSEVGGNIVNGLKNGIEWAKDGLSSLGASLANAVKGGATAAAQINSPSKVFAWIGEMMDLGLANGLIDNLDDVTQAGSTVADEAAMALQDAMNHVGDAVDDDMTMTPVIRPVVDLSDIKSGSAQMDRMLNSGLYTTGLNGFPMGNVSANSSLVNAINSLNANQNPYSGINIYVTGGDGANAEEIADEVMRRLDREVQRRKAVFA